MPQIFSNDDGHGHAQRGREVLQGHSAQILGTLQEMSHTIAQIVGVAGPIEFNCEILFFGHLPEILQVGADDRNAIGACQMRHAARPRGRRIWHDERRSALKQILDLVFLDVTGELNTGMGSILFLHRLDVSGGLGMIAAGDDQFHVWKAIGNLPEGVNHQLQFFVGAPFSKCQDAVRISAP